MAGEKVYPPRSMKRPEAAATPAVERGKEDGSVLRPEEEVAGRILLRDWDGLLLLEFFKDHALHPWTPLVCPPLRPQVR
ncbi:Hypothetical protein NTJ_16336 [Nesidiocoris tenuis]|nr:Hypothetical protein NTJ_16336 [Nesidiocoris tenuis]